MQLILPKTYPALEAYRELPMFFLAGPIQGGGDWQVPMSELLMKCFERLIVVNPSRYQHPHPFVEYRMKGEEKHFERQTDWERYYLDQAAEKWPTGCIIFWLAEQKEPRQDGQPYARNTYGEIGEWRGRMICSPCQQRRIVMGAEKNFPGLSQIKRNFELAIPDFKICDTMEEVVERVTFFAYPTFD